MLRMLSLCFLTILPWREALAAERMQVIGAGFGRTATSSMKLALEKLGYKTMHMSEIRHGPEKQILEPAWTKFVMTPGVLGSNLEDLPAAAVGELLTVHADLGFNASVDFPSMNLYLHQFRRNPDAKVVLTLRSSAETWAASFMETIARSPWILNQLPFKLLPSGRLFTLTKWMFESAGMKLDEDTYMPTNPVEAYHSWAAKVKSTVPPEKLLVHEAKDGWKPLCDFLGVPVPGEPYPKAPNDRDFLLKRIGRGEMIAKYFVPVLAIVVIAVVFVVRVCVTKIKQKSN